MADSRLTDKPPRAADRPRLVRDDLVTLTYYRLRQAITSGALAPGARVVERELGQELGISRTPVRSALHRLQQEGYIAGTGNGARQLVIAPLTRADARELFAMVGVVEGLAAREAAQLAPLKRTRLALELTRLNRELREEAESARPQEGAIFELDAAFHLRCVESGAGPRLRGLHEALKPQAERYARLYANMLTSEIGTSVREHELIIRALDEGEPELARTRMETNWANASSRLAEVMQRAGERSDWS
jgi:DNA-binding GntR family transcriptional regulator